jgi:hypothetical protein
MGRRILNRKELRADFDAAERRKDDDEVVDEEEGEEEEDEEEKGEDEEGEADADADADAESEGEGEDDEDAPKKKKPAKPKAKAPKAAKPKSRSRAAKIVRMRLVWGVFNNSHQCVATYEYPKRDDANAHAAKLTADKKSTHFVQPVKETIEEKKEKA